MPIQAQTADGMMHEFPDGTPDAVVDKAMSDYTTNEMPYNQFTQEQNAQTGNTPELLDLQTEAAKGIPILGAAVPDAPGSKQLEKEHPIISKIAQGAGAAISTAPLMLAAPAAFGADAAAPMLTNVLKAGGTFGTLGAVDTAAHGGSLKDIGISGGVNAITGGAAPLVGKAIGGVAKWGLNLIKPEAESILSKMNPLAVKQAAAAMKAEGLTDEQINQKIIKLGPEGLLSEYGPEMQGLAKAVVTSPGAQEGKQAIMSAVENRAQPDAVTARIKQGLDEAMGPAENMATAKREAVVNRAEGAEEPYDVWRATKITPTPAVKQLTQELEAHGLLASAKAIAARKSLATGQPVEPMENFFTTGERKDWPTAASWDYVKQAVDDKIASSYNGYRPTEATRDWVQLKNRIIDTVAKSSPDAAEKWEAARDSWSNPSEVIRAQERGAGVWNNKITDDELLHELTNYSQPARDAYKKAARAALEEQLDSSVRGNAKVTNLLQGKNAADKFRIITGNKNTNPEKLLNQVQNETAFMHAPKELGNSQANEAYLRQKQALTPNPKETLVGRFEERFPYAAHVFNPIRALPGYGTAKSFLTGRQAAQYEAARNVLGPLLASKGQQAQEYARALNNYNSTPRGLQPGLSTSALLRALAQPTLSKPASQ